MKKNILLKIFIFYLVFICVCLFLPAGSFMYWEAWIYSVVLFIPLIITVSYLHKKDPELLERRMRFKEKEEKQKTIANIHVFIHTRCPGIVVCNDCIYLFACNSYIQNL